jgi:hypothetical protein
MPKSKRVTPATQPETQAQAPTTVAPKAPLPPTVHKHAGTSDYLRTLANRVAAFERRLPDPSDALNQNEAERRAGAKAQCRRASRNLGNAASNVLKMYRGFPAAAALVHDCVDASDRIKAELDALYKVIPEDTFMAMIREGSIHAGANTPTYNRMQALTEALTYLDWYQCSNPACRALLPDDLPVIETVAPQEPTTPLKGAAAAYAEMYAADQAVIKANTPPPNPNLPARLACPVCGETLRHKYIGQFSNLSALREFMPGTQWNVGTNMNETEQWLLDTERAIDEVVHEVDSAIVFAERIESGPDDDHATQVPDIHVTDVKAPTTDQLKAQAYASMG